jgi:hypothetical protein
MNKKRLHQLTEVIRGAFQKAGTPIDDTALRFASDMARNPLFQELIDHPERVSLASFLMGYMQVAETKTDLPQSEWETHLERVGKDLIYQLRPEFKTYMKEMVNRLPRRPSTGRRQTLNSDDQRNACDLISRYERNGDSKRAAYAKAAREMNCSPRTIQRIWKKRADLHHVAISASSGRRKSRGVKYL